MHAFFQRGENHSRNQRPTWLRLIALVAVLMVCVMSTVQVSHNHAAPLKQSQNHNGPVTDDHCPLCVAMHSALPVAMHAPEPILHVQTLDSVAANAQRIFRWRFQMASRPPPSTNPA